MSGGGACRRPLLWLCAALALVGVTGQSCEGCLYSRPPAQAALPPEHPRLARSTGADAHAPEQVIIIP